MADNHPPGYGQDGRANPSMPPPPDIDAVWQESLRVRGIQVPVFSSQSVAGLWKDRWGDSPEAFYYRAPLLELVQRIEALCQRILRQLAARANDRLIICSAADSNASSIRTSFSEGRNPVDSEPDSTSNRISVGSSISSISEMACAIDDGHSGGSTKPTFKSKPIAARKSKFSEATMPDQLGLVAETILEMRPGVALIESQVNEYATQIQAYLLIMEQTRKQFASLHFNLSKKQQASQPVQSTTSAPSNSLVKKSASPSVQTLQELANSIDPAAVNSAENAQLVLKKLAGIAQECASKLKDCSTALNLAVSQCKSVPSTIPSTAATTQNTVSTTSSATGKSKKTLDPIAEAAITSQIAQAKQTVDMLSDALWAEGTEVGMERLEKEAEKAVRELDERIERASRGLASLGNGGASGGTGGGSGKGKGRKRGKR